LHVVVVARTAQGQLVANGELSRMVTAAVD